MTEPFVNSEVDRTKSRWVAKVLKEFGRKSTTTKALFYYALQRKEPDYPICGGFVGEIRILRMYHESDGEKLLKWANKAKSLGYIPEGALVDGQPGEHIFLLSPFDMDRPKDIGSLFSASEIDAKPFRRELWLNRSSLNQILLPVCIENGINLVSVDGMPSNEAVRSLCERAQSSPTQVFCLSDLSLEGMAFCRDLTRSVAESCILPDIYVQVIHLGLTPSQVLQLCLPMISDKDGYKDGSRLERASYQKYLKPHGLKSNIKAELDALEVYYPGGVAAFVMKEISKRLCSSEDEDMLLHIRGGKIMVK
jgi:hypothetical protein